jgi:hypothetical protein
MIGLSDRICWKWSDDNLRFYPANMVTEPPVSNDSPVRACLSRMWRNCFLGRNTAAFQPFLLSVAETSTLPCGDAICRTLCECFVNRDLKSSVFSQWEIVIVGLLNRAANQNGVFWIKYESYYVLPKHLICLGNSSAGAVVSSLLDKEAQGMVHFCSLLFQKLFPIDVRVPITY